MSVFALNITPIHYIFNHYAVAYKLLYLSLKRCNAMARDGRKKIVEITRYLTIGLGLLESVMMVIGFIDRITLQKRTPLTVIMVVTSLTAGSAVLMWIGGVLQKRV